MYLPRYPHLDIARPPEPLPAKSDAHALAADLQNTNNIV